MDTTVLLGDNMNTQLSLDVFSELGGVICVCVGVYVCLFLMCHLVIPIHSAGFSFTDSSWGDRAYCLQVYQT